MAVEVATRLRLAEDVTRRRLLNTTKVFNSAWRSSGMGSWKRCAKLSTRFCTKCRHHQHCYVLVSKGTTTCQLLSLHTLEQRGRVVSGHVMPWTACHQNVMGIITIFRRRQQMRVGGKG
jgi:hypothetical protein